MSHTSSLYFHGGLLNYPHRMVWPLYADAQRNEQKAPERVFMCDTCLRFWDSASALRKHTENTRSCDTRAPPGREVWRSADSSASVFFVDGASNPRWCQRLNLWLRALVRDKTALYEAALFQYYVYCEVDTHEMCMRVVGAASRSVAFPNPLSVLAVWPSARNHGVALVLAQLAYIVAHAQPQPSPQPQAAPEEPWTDGAAGVFRRLFARRLYEVVRDKLPTRDAWSVADLARAACVPESAAESVLASLRPEPQVCECGCVVCPRHTESALCADAFTKLPGFPADAACVRVADVVVPTDMWRPWGSPGAAVSQV